MKCQKLALQSLFIFLVCVPRFTWAAMTFSELESRIKQVTRNGRVTDISLRQKVGILESIHQQFHVMGKPMTTGLIDVPSDSALRKKLPILFSNSPAMQEILKALNARRRLLSKSNVISVSIAKVGNGNNNSITRGRIAGTFEFTNNLGLTGSLGFKTCNSRQSKYDLVNFGSLNSIQEAAHFYSLDLRSSLTQSLRQSFQNLTMPETAEEDHRVASQLLALLENDIGELSNQFKIQNKESVVDGISIYLKDRRDRGKGLTRDQLISLVVPDVEDANPKHLSLDTAWLNLYHHSSQNEGSHPLSHKELRAVKESKADLASYQPVAHPFIRGAMADVSTVKDKAGQVHFVKVQGNGQTIQTQNALGEVAAYHVSKLLGLDVVSKTLLTEEKGSNQSENRVASLREKISSSFEQGAALKRQSSKFTSKNVLKDPRWQDAISDLRVVEYLLGADDRNLANLFFDVESYRVQGIDYNDIKKGIPLAYEKANPFSGGLLPVRYSNKALNERLQSITYQELHSELHDLALDEEIENIWLRVQIVKADMNRQLLTILSLQK